MKQVLIVAQVIPQWYVDTLTEAFGEKALVSNGKLVWASVAGGFLEQHDQQIEQLEVNGIVLVDGEKIFGEVIGGQKKIVICGGGHVSMPIIQLGRQIGNTVRPAVFLMEPVNYLLHGISGPDDLCLDLVAYRLHKKSSYIYLIKKRSRYALWHNRFAVWRKISLSPNPFRIAGVMSCP